MISFLSGLTSGKRRALFFVVSIVIIVAFYMFVVSPINKRVQSIDDEIAQKQMEIKEDEDFYAQKSIINREIKNLSKYFTDKTPEDGVVNGEILGLIERISSRSNVKLLKSSPATVDATEQYKKYLVELECQGTLKDVISFIYSINSTDQLLKVDQLKMSPRRGEENQVRASLVLSKLLVSL